jgi:Protein of unknown function (DUF2752)
MSHVEDTSPLSAANYSVAELRQSELFAHKFFLAGAVGVMLLSFLLSLPDNSGVVTVPGMNWSLPPLCTLKRTCGIDCPGCGLTRSFVALAHGDWEASIRYNAGGPLCFLLMMLQIPYRLWQMRRNSLGKPEIFAGWFTTLSLLLASIFLTLQWIAKQW